MNITMERPAALDEMVGQEAVISQLRIAFKGAEARGIQPPHTLLSGPPGHGKTTLAKIVAAERNSALVTTTGPALRRPGDLAGILANVRAGTVIFIDEIHRLTQIVEETLYEVLEDGTLSVTVGSGAAAKAITLRFPPITVVGATTKPGALATPFRDRFGLHLTVKPYSDAELAQIVERSWDRAEVRYTKGAAEVVADRSKGVPRLALHLASRACDVGAIEGKEITPSLAERALEAFGIEEGGMDEIDVKIVTALCKTFAGRAVGLSALSQFLDIDPATMQNQHEPFLVRSGLMIRTGQGRMATELAHEWLGARSKPRRQRTPIERVLRLVDPPNAEGCRLFRGHLTEGYGRMLLDPRRGGPTTTTTVHRIVYEDARGPVPDGLKIDHTCHNGSDCPGGPTCRHRACTTLEHLEAVTHAVNSGRSHVIGRKAATECVHGHPFDEVNTRIDRRWKRVCRKCATRRSRESRARLAA